MTPAGGGKIGREDDNQFLSSDTMPHRFCTQRRADRVVVYAVSLKLRLEVVINAFSSVIFGLSRPTSSRLPHLPKILKLPILLQCPSGRAVNGQCRVSHTL